MNERQEQTADVLGKLTVLGTIVLPMNIICGMWGMNVKVPGQDIESLSWFWSSEFFFFLPLPSLFWCIAVKILPAAPPGLHER
jgi:Mg2+ and Co2+ transporter CorA